jgi:hypothetical protein
MKPKEFHEAFGCSWQGKTTLRDGHPIRCGHKHRTWQAAEKCAKKMRKNRPGKCQDYRSFLIVYRAMRKKKP